MERRDSPQESHGLCHRLFRLIMNSLAFQSLKRIALRHPGDRYVPVSTFHQNKDHSVADGSFSSSKNLIEVQKDGKFGNENTTLTAVIKAGNGHKAIIRKKGGGDDRERLNGKVIDMNIIPVKIPGMVDKEAPTEDRGATAAATTPKVTQGGDANTVVIMHGDTPKRDDGKNNTNLTIDEKAEQFIKMKRASHSRNSTNESKSGGPQKKKPHP